MSIETTLTVALAAGILVFAFLVRTVVMGIARASMLLWRTMRGTRPERPTARSRVHRPRHRAHSAGAVRFLYRRSLAAYRWSVPRVAAGYRHIAAEAENAYSGRQGAETWQALGEALAPWGGGHFCGPPQEVTAYSSPWRTTPTRS